MSEVSDTFIMSSGTAGPILVLRRFNNGFPKWIAFFDHERGKISTYDGLASTAEEAIERFIKYRINKEPFFSMYSNYVVLDE